MSNDKVAATYHGGCTCQTGLCARHPLLDPVDVLRDRSTCCWMGKHTNGEDHVRMCPNYQTTGEHTKAKLADPQYGVAAIEAAAGMAWTTSRLAQHTGSAVPGVPTSEERYAGEPSPVYRVGGPTKRELQIAAALFLVLIAVSGWVFRALG